MRRHLWTRPTLTLVSNVPLLIFEAEMQISANSNGNRKLSSKFETMDRKSSVRNKAGHVNDRLQHLMKQELQFVIYLLSIQERG